MSRFDKATLPLVALIAFLVLSGYGERPDSVPSGPVRPATPNLSVTLPAHTNYAGVCRQLADWEREAPGLTVLRIYGTSSRGQKMRCLYVGNQLVGKRRSVLVTACIHGNEPLSPTVVESYAGRLLSGYGREERLTALLDGLDICFVPVVSPDSYPDSRHVDGVDPNRDFPGPHDPHRNSTPAIAALQVLFCSNHFRAAWSGHTFGRVFLTPYGDTNERCPHDVAYERLFGRMATLADYKHIRACEMYGTPIHGSEVDWYYRQGACSCVCEYGTHQHAPTLSDTTTELDRTWEAFLLFLQEAPTLVTTGHANLSQYILP